MLESTYTLKIVEVSQTGDIIDISPIRSLLESNSSGEWESKKLQGEIYWLYWGDFSFVRRYR